MVRGSLKRRAEEHTKYPKPGVKYGNPKEKYFVASMTGMVSTASAVAIHFSDPKLRPIIGGTSAFTAVAYGVCWWVGPGQVPWDWGFHATDTDRTRRRRYCKLCDSWKPERTHHCSICNRCNLNMDHHCPWIHTCIGFHNRKFFFQTCSFACLNMLQLGGASLIRILRDGGVAWADGVVAQVAATGVCLTWCMHGKIGLLTSALSGLVCLGTGVMTCLRFAGVSKLQSFQRPPLLPWVALAFGSVFTAGLGRFLRSHVRLALSNYTTIENLDKDEGAISKYDLGWRPNLEQIFGPVLSLWWLPLPIRMLSPVGTGLLFPTQPMLHAALPGQEVLTKRRKQGDQMARWLQITVPARDDRRETLLAELFLLHDLDGNGTIEKSELKAVNERIHFLHHGAPSAEQSDTLSRQFSTVFREIDTNKDGHVDCAEFVAYYEDYLYEIERDMQAQLWILEQFIAELQSARQTEFEKDFVSEWERSTNTRPIALEGEEMEVFI